MRSVDDASSKWHFLESQNSIAHLKQHLYTGARENHVFSNTAGLRSAFWKAFLVTKNLNLDAWPAQLGEKRVQYAAYREHYLRGPREDETDSFSDPLTEASNPVWTEAQKDDAFKQEIFQDVERCMPENLYFRQPATQTMLLETLFIWSKLNQDVGYRQGMHEILAPIVWTIERDAIDPLSASRTTTSTRQKAMLETFNATWVEHDSFIIFAAVMESLKSAFAATSTKAGGHKYSTSISSEPEIVARSKRVVGDLLAAADPQLASHIIELEIAPQLFVMKWIRLLFGREFPFDQCMDLWDLLFAEEASAEIIDLVCVSMLLQIRWQLINSDYNSALTTLLNYPPLPANQHPSSFIEDATRLRSALDIDTGRSIIFKRTGRIPKSQAKPAHLSANPTRRNDGDGQYPSLHSPHLLPPPRPSHHPSNSFEAVLQNAARSVYSSGERLGVNKAVRDAVGDVRRNAQSISTNIRNRTHSRNVSLASNSEEQAANLQKRLDNLQLRNQSLAKMLESAVNELWKQQKEMAIANSKQASADSDEKVKSLTMAIARVQLAQVYLEDPDLPLPEDEVIHSPHMSDGYDGKSEVLFAAPNYAPGVAIEPPPDDLAQSPPQASPGVDESSFYFQEPLHKKGAQQDIAAKLDVKTAPMRPSLEKSEFSYMLGQEETLGDKPTANTSSKNASTRPSIEKSSFSWMLGQTPPSGQETTQGNDPFDAKAELRGASRRAKAHGNNGFLFGEAEEEAVLPGTGKPEGEPDDLFAI